MNTELAWCAGLFDGEGCVTYVEHNGKSTTRAIRAIITQINSGVLYRFQAATGVGSVIGPYAAKGRKTPLYTYHVTNEKDVRYLFSLLRPYLSLIKMTQFIEKLHEWDARPSKRGVRH